MTILIIPRDNLTFYPVYCPICDGAGVLLGTLGNLDHFRCEDCSMGFSAPAIEEEPEPKEPEDAKKTVYDLTWPQDCMYFEIFCNRDPAVGIPDIYEKVSFKTGMVFTDANDAEETRRLFGQIFYELYAGFNPLILFDFEPHDYYKPSEQDREIWYTVLAVERGPNGRELAINKPDTLSTAIDLAEEYDNRADHGYEKIIVRRQPDGEIVWSSLEQDRPKEQ